jgi:hypothetical protein
VCGSTGIPVLSQLCDLANAFGYAVEGDLVNTGISLGGLVPGIGDAGTIGRIAAKESGLARTDRTVCSFTGDTKVLMADGSTKPIAEIKIGDQVVAADPRTGEHGARMVTAVLVHDDTVLDLVTEDGAKVTTTEDHPFYDATDQAWERADQLDRGDELSTATGDRVRVTGLRASSEHLARAYNLTVSGLHTYHVLVGAAPILVHNDCGPVSNRRPERLEDELATARSMGVSPVAAGSEAFQEAIAGNGRYLWAVDTSGTLRIVPDRPGIHHTVLTGGDQVLGAGEVTFRNGVVETINNRTGHYRPCPECSQQFLQVGVDAFMAAHVPILRKAAQDLGG